MGAPGAAVLQDDAGQTGARERPKGQRRTVIEYFAELDVAMRETAIYVIDRKGKWSSKSR
jgi:hypothetical protein